MSAIGPGSWLEAVVSDASLGHEVRAGAVYRCSAILGIPGPGLVWFCQRENSMLASALELEGMPDAPWCACTFKPGGYRPSEEIQRLLKAPSSVREDA